MTEDQQDHGSAPPSDDTGRSNAAPPPRLLPTLAVAFGVLPAAMVVAGIVIGVAMVASVGTGAIEDRDNVMDWLAEFAATPVGLMVLVLPAELVFAAAAIGPALLSPTPFRTRLGLTRSRVRWPGVLVVMLGTPMCGLFGVLLVKLLGRESSEVTEMLAKVMTANDGPAMLFTLAVMSVLPGIFEELFFRGYVLTRLLRRWNAALAIGFTSIMFALAHFDPVHSPAVLPLGIWLGVVTWRCGSVWPAIACHFFNNLLAIVGANMAGDPSTMAIEADMTTIVTVAVPGTAFVASIVTLVRARNS